MRALVLFPLVACAPVEVDSSVDLASVFCAEVEEGGTWEQEAASDVAESSGLLFARVITDESDDPRDPVFVAYRDYTLEPAETGGVQTVGKTTGDGIVEKTLGVGTWHFQATWTRGSTTCKAEMEIPIAAQTTTYACALLTCP
ncbi:MAG: hypothetical protein FJ102_24540 [Deltaproteobacteria bacterium]|nr:hypothetical protein [Deltaproteobacteria bacterium]